MVLGTFKLPLKELGEIIIASSSLKHDPCFWALYNPLKLTLE